MLDNYIGFDLVLSDIKATNKKQIFKDLARALSKKMGIGESQLLIKLASQDKQLNNSIGNGVAMPQVKISSLNKPVISFVRIHNGGEFDTIDGEPIDMICCILTPDTMSGEQLQRIASMTRMFNNKILCNKLRAAEDADHIRQIMMDMGAIKRAA